MDSGVIASKVFVFICSASKYRQRRNACRETWLSNSSVDIQHGFFIGGTENVDEIDVIQLNASDDYANLTRKVMALFSYALENYTFDYLFKCDDDTYVVLDRLRELVADQPAVKGYIWYDGRGCLSGGAGYLIRRDCLQAIRDAMVPHEACEDVAVTQAARRLGIPIVHTDRLQCGHGKFPRSNNDKVSSHWCKPEEMRKIHASFQVKPEELHREMLRVRANEIMASQEPLFSLELKHEYWKDTVLFYENGLFARTQSACRGQWHRDERGWLKLDWFDWDEEWIHSVGDMLDEYVFWRNSEGEQVKEK